jgi:spore coat polysaccharide biosynthesis protein SpsF (cytidylyltransferase family)
MTKIVAIIQARMGSTRLPNKVMESFSQGRLIEILLKRLEHSLLIDQVVLATSLNKENDVLSKFVSSLGYEVFRGDEDNVLQRFRDAALKYNADIIVRITGDTPLIDPAICDELINFHKDNLTDYSYLSDDYCEGVDCEVFSIAALLSANENALKASEYEHVTLYFYNNPLRFNCQPLANNSDDSCYRFTVDNKEDAKVVSHIVDFFSDEILTVTTQQIKIFLDNFPEIKAINQHIIRNEGLLISLNNENSIK